MSLKTTGHDDGNYKLAEIASCVIGGLRVVGGVDVTVEALTLWNIHLTK